MKTIIEMAREAEFENLIVNMQNMLKAAALIRANECGELMQAITDPENQPSQYGTVTLDYHFAKLKEWEDRFAKLSDRALAQPEQEPEWYHGVDQRGCNRFYHKTEVRPREFSTQLYIAPPEPDERNFCPRCGKRTADLTTIHTCTPPQGNT
jgi:hypothetical protein